jgi:hypothetical protein
MIVNLEAKSLINQLNNIVQYSTGFLDGIEAAKPEFMNNLGTSVIELMKNFIDSNARVNPETLHHVYEWYQTGSPEARLFDIDYIVQGKNTLSFNYTFSQSTSYSNGSTEPFYNKATIMEDGNPVIIRPRVKGGVLSFDDNGEQIFTKKPIVVTNPGGSGVQGGFEKTLKNFFDNYFSQSFIVSSGILEHFNNPKPYKDNLKSGSIQGKPLGFRVGYEWVIKGGKIEQ